MAYCKRCGRHFPHERDRVGLKEHFAQSYIHDYCQMCDGHFDPAESLEDHEDEDHYTCRFCDSIFCSEKGLHEHNRQRHLYCAACRRVFQSESNLNAHLNSSVHKPKTVRCPGANCGRGFVSRSALVLHFEAGTCPSGLTRDELNRMVTRMDRKNVITNPVRLVKEPDGYRPATVTTTWATERSWNGNAYECFLCHQTFRALHGLNAHLQSPRHQEKIYRCPDRTFCGLEFRVLSSLTQHVESGKCGVCRFKEAQNALDSLASGVREVKI